MYEDEEERGIEKSVGVHQILRDLRSALARQERELRTHQNKSRDGEDAAQCVTFFI